MAEILHAQVKHYRVVQKNRTCLSVDNFATISGKKACDMSKVSGCFKEKASDLHSGSFKYFLPNVHK